MHSIKLMWIIVTVIVVAGLFLAGYGLGTNQLGRVISKISADYRVGYADGAEAARIKIAESGVLPPARQNLNSISGNVKAIDGNKITISGAGRISPNPLDPQGPDERTINVSDKTVVKAIVPLTPAEFNAALAKYNMVVKQNKTASPPSPFVEKIVGVSDIKLTMAITVTASGDISNAVTIDAETVSFTATPSTVSL
jgi:hypothetical protein